MNKTPVFTTLAGLVAMTLASAANAITIDATSPDWSNAVGGSGVAYDLANGAFTDVRWGDPVGTEKSGLGFDPVNPPSLDYAPGESFLLGNLRHYNNPIFAG